MKLKYYLNGFGVGVLFATIILSVSFLFRADRTAEMTDQEIMVRAKELGMELVTTTAEEITSAPEETTEELTTVLEETAAEETTSVPEETTEELTTVLEETAAEEITTVPEDTQAETLEQSEITPDTKIVIQINAGMSSEAVAGMLEESGVVDSAADLDSYLVNQGVARSIRTGSFEFYQGMPYEEIVKKICQ